MVDAVLFGLDESEAVVTRIDVEEIRLEGTQEIVAETKPENISVERNDLVDPFGGKHGMTHAEWSGTESGYGTARLERIGGDLGAIESFEAVADRIGKDNQIGHPALIGERARTARDVDLAVLQVGRQSIQSGSVRNFPAVERGRIVGVGL